MLGARRSVRSMDGPGCPPSGTTLVLHYIYELMTMEQSEGDQERRIGDLLPLAEALHEAISRRLSDDAETATFDIDRIIDQAFGDVAKETARERLAQLTPTEFAALYVGLHGEQSLGDLLETMRSLKERQLQREVRLAQMSHEALTTGLLRLELLEPNEVIEVGLFDPSLPHMAARRFVDDPEHRPLHRKIAMRVVGPATGAVRILHDVWTAPVWARSAPGAPLAPHAYGVIGIPGDADLEPVLSHRTSMAYRMSGQDEVIIPDQIVGYVEMNSGELLLG